MRYSFQFRIATQWISLVTMNKFSFLIAWNNFFSRVVRVFLLFICLQIKYWKPECMNISTFQCETVKIKEFWFIQIASVKPQFIYGSNDDPDYADGVHVYAAWCHHYHFITSNFYILSQKHLNLFIHARTRLSFVYSVCAFESTNR